MIDTFNAVSSKNLTSDNLIRGQESISKPSRVIQMVLAGS
jgi:hypothetical protein